MSLSKNITVLYKTLVGTVWNTEQEALIAEAIESAGSYYLEDWKKKSIVEAITTKLLVVPIINVDYIKEKKDEALRTSESNEPTAEAES
jgi:hypothetical protein